MTFSSLDKVGNEMAAKALANTNARERAIERARQSGLEIMGRGYRKRDKALVWMVPSQSEANRWHTVTQIGDHLECDCTAGQHVRVCIHRAVVFLALSAEASVFAARHAQHSQAPAAAAAVAHPGAAAPLYRSNAPSSLFKAS